MSPNLRTGLMAGTLALGMVGLGYASVPLYRLFCQVTGFAGTTQRAEAAILPPSMAVTGKTISVRFDANRALELPWDFAPERKHETVQIGQREIAFFTAKNLGDTKLKGTAAFNVTPTQAGKYFTKIQCFCFNEQTLNAGQQVRMPVIFYVDPAILNDPDAKDISEITLSYTFYPVDEGKKPS